jgi:corrinoid protein of di/trimethylamine methyltransferase
MNVLSASLPAVSGLQNDHWTDQPKLACGALEEERMTSDLHSKLAQAVVEGDAETAEQLARQALEEGMDPLACIDNGLIKGIQKVGELFAEGEYYLPELIIGADVLKSALAILEPALLEGQQREVVGRVVLGTVEGDMHEIGKTLVGTILTANGFKVLDIGVDNSTEAFIAAVKEIDADIVGASALLTTTMGQQKKLIEALQQAGLREKVKVMVGGAPVTAKYADEIGADGYAEDAISVLDLAYRLMDAPT